MSIIVQKYGGSSVSDVDKIHKVAALVVETKRRGHDVVVVVSAMGKTTDQLLQLAREVDESPPRRELDMLLSTGERITMALLSMAIQKRGIDAISFTGSQSGIITNDRHSDARIIDVRPHRVEDELARGRVVIVAGYQGMSYKREITTLGRGGSDTTALAMAAALNATHAEIYSDVDGIYSADPRQVPEARHLPAVGYDEMQQMSEAGAKVLHAQAVEFARRARISIVARSTFAPGRESVIRDLEPGDAPRAVVGQAGLARVRLSAGAATSASDSPERITEALAYLQSRAAVVRDVHADEGGARFYVVASQSPGWSDVANELETRFEASITTGLGCATVVGGAPQNTPQTVMNALQTHGIVPSSLASAPLRVAAMVAESELEKAVRVLHRTLISEDADT